MRPDDFFTAAQGRYDTMGIDRLACMRAGGDILGFPVLVIDGGTCMTHTACNEEGKLMGGGISTLGVGAKFAAIAQNTQSAPGMVAAIAQSHEDLIGAASEMAKASNPLPLFSNNTADTVVPSALLEVTYYCREVIKKYLDEIYVETGTDEPVKEDDQVYQVNGAVIQRPSRNRKVPKIVLAGGDADLLQSLLKTEDNQLVVSNPDIRPYEVTVCKHLMAFGIANALKDKVKKHKGTPVSEFDKLLLGCRVAKQFSAPDADGDRVY
jgi:pantothenate kinase type III